MIFACACPVLAQQTPSQPTGQATAAPNSHSDGSHPAAIISWSVIGAAVGSLLGSSVVAAVINQFWGARRERELAHAVGRAKIMEFLTERRQALAEDADLLAIIGFLKS